MRLDRVRRPGGETDGAAEEHVVAQQEVGRQALPHRRRVRLDPRVELLRRAVLEQPHLVPLVVVENEHGQETADVGPDDPGTADVELLRVRLLAQTTVTS